MEGKERCRQSTRSCISEGRESQEALKISLEVWYMHQLCLNFHLSTNTPVFLSIHTTVVGTDDKLEWVIECSDPKSSKPNDPARLQTRDQCTVATKAIAARRQRPVSTQSCLSKL